MNENIMEMLRQRRGLEPDDKSQDAQIVAMKPRKKLEELCGWELGDPQWAAVFLHWAGQCGYDVKEL